MQDMAMKHPAFSFGDFVNGADVRMKERSGGPGFLNEPSPVFLAGDGVRGKKLERHRPAEGEVLGLVDHTHAAFAEL